MPTLSELTDPTAVNQAIKESIELGRDEFLERYSLTRSRDYFVPAGKYLIDSKPLLPVAYGKRYPDRGLLPWDRFNGGPNGAGRALERLGFGLTTRAIKTHPSSVSSSTPMRTSGRTAMAATRWPASSASPGKTP